MFSSARNLDEQVINIYYHLISFVLCLSIGYIFSISSIWKYCFPSTDKSYYLKAGEYGETEIKQTWSLWKEPWNAWSSLSYSLFGFIMLFVAIHDYNKVYTLNIPFENENRNSPSFGVLFSLQCIYLGISSFLFHASHFEVWRKADAGMTSGIAAVPFVIAIHSRLAIPFMSAHLMTFLAFVLQASFTHGYMPYGSSDVVLPSLIGISWILELTPFYNGVVRKQELNYWLECALYALSGMLLRALDIKRKSSLVFQRISCIFVAVVVTIGCFLGIDNIHLYVVSLAGIIVFANPEKGHIVWHLFSSYSLFHGWELGIHRPMPTMLPSDPSRPDLLLLTILFFGIIKNALRRLLMIHFPSSSIMQHNSISTIDRAVWGISLFYIYYTISPLLLYSPKLLLGTATFPSKLCHLYVCIRSALIYEDGFYSFLVRKSRESFVNLLQLFLCSASLIAVLFRYFSLGTTGNYY